MSITKAQHREPAVAAPRVLSDLILAFNAALEFQREYPREMNAARALFDDYDRELTVMLGAVGSPRDAKETT